MTHRTIWLAILCAACTGEAALIDGGGTDSGDRTDAGVFDAGRFDAGMFDAGMFDGGMADGGGLDPDGGRDAGRDAGPDAGMDAGCITREITFAVPPVTTCYYDASEVDRSEEFYVVLRTGARIDRPVCQRSGGICGSDGRAPGWWWSDSTTISVCDETCSQFFDLGASARLVAVYGCGDNFCPPATP